MTPRIGLAISGGGFRAVAFGLGALRALNDRGLLAHINVISGVSGGSLLAALYSYGPASFDDFEQLTEDLLASGLQMALVRHAARPDVFVPAAATSMLAAISGRGAMLAGRTRTDSLATLLTRRAFGDRALSEVNHPDLVTIINATDLRTGTAFRFGSNRVASSRYGRTHDSIRVADAVAASCAFPALLPAVERRFTFTGLDGTHTTHAVSLTDGGVYDNLGLSVLEPGRSRGHTAHVYDLDYIVAVDAGTGRPRVSRARVLPFRLKRTLDIIHIRSQDGGRARLHQAAAAGAIKGFVHAYLGMDDKNLPTPLTDLVPRETVERTKTDFRSMAIDDRDRLSRRGEQLTSALIGHYHPDLA